MDERQLSGMVADFYNGLRTSHGERESIRLTAAQFRIPEKELDQMLGLSGWSPFPPTHH